MKRRRVLEGVGAALGIASVAGTALGRPGGGAPPNAPSTNVNPFGPSQEVPVGNWIVHRHGFVATTDCQTEREARSTIEDFLASVESTVVVGGEEIPNPDQYWRMVTCRETDQCDSGWAATWRYATPPGKPGTVNNYDVTVTLDPPVESSHNNRDGECITNEVEGFVYPGGEYEVVKR